MPAALASKGGHQGEIGETLAGNYGPDWRNWPWGPRLAQMEVSSCAASSGESTLRRISSVLALSQPLTGQPLWKTGVGSGKSHCSALLINRCRNSSSANSPCSRLTPAVPAEPRGASPDQGSCWRATSWATTPHPAAANKKAADPPIAKPTSNAQNRPFVSRLCESPQMRTGLIDLDFWLG